ncbi:tRNA pseudouridine synthase [Mitosporidium daphniae]|uniref:tRNA pseudouridine synthase n=1 Tax=Mitosporidium daphniae TaxID=1485682 RepID=A0A098VMW3_9MICR|nr:tRNA pseudouridine synthase [Mitosporidium daphniae]KGG50392.1 tRNA pseudouridine synthase [Mitosporidium daphniae]|eukprot:XP_013236819.1 tRNA pseudouridine synthase [Mitosporidium daphniae]
MSETLDRTEMMAPPVKFPKKKVALVLAYLGTNYQGMQMYIGLMRACRTDKGVHAAMQVVSLKVIFKDPIASIMSSINSHLPKDIRVCGIHPVSQTFDSKLHCDSRFYEYLLPTFMFKCDSSFDLSFLENMAAKRDTLDGKNEAASDGSECEDNVAGNEDQASMQKHKLAADFYSNNFKPTLADIEQLSAFRLSSKEKDRLDALLKCFEGSHFFHNYTIKKSAVDPSACRKIISFSKAHWYPLPLIPRNGDHDYASRCPGLFDGHFQESFEIRKNECPKSPWRGSLVSSKINPLSYDTYALEIDSFKEKEIYPAIASEEFSKNIFMNWWCAISLHAYDFQYVLQQWTPPDSEVSKKKIKKGKYSADQASQSEPPKVEQKNPDPSISQ